MIKKLLLLSLVLTFAAPAAIASELWLHVRVEGKTGDEEIVRVNIPLSLVKAVLPMINEAQLRDGKIVLDAEGDLQGIDLQELWKAIQDTPDGDYVRVKSKEENVRVAKEKGFLLVNVDNSKESVNETVRVTIPLAVVDALLSTDSTELDIMAAINALGAYSGDLVTVQDGDTFVRIWIDDQQEMS